MNRKFKILLGILGVVSVPMLVWAGTAPRNLRVVDTPTDEECLTFESSQNAFEWQSCTTTPLTSDLVLENSEVIDNGTDGTINLGRNDSGTVTLGSIDDDTTADLTINPGGTSTLTLGAAADTVTVAATTGLTLANTESVNTGTDAVFDFTRNDAGIVTLTCSDNDATAGCTYDAGGASPIVIGSADVTNIQFRGDTDFDFANGATGNVDVSLRDYADTTDDDMAHTLLRTNCTDAGTGAEDCDFSILVPEAGADVSSRFSIDADGGVTVGGATNDTVILAPDVDVQIQNQATGNVTLDFRDYADTDDDDQAHVLMTANCTTATTGAEDCDFTIGVAEAGAAPQTRFDIDADAGITLGSANTDSFTVNTDGSGTAEVVLPNNSIDADEILDDTIIDADFSSAACLQVISGEFNPTEASATDDYLNLVDNTFSTTEADEDMFRVPVAAVANTLNVVVATAPGAGNDPWVITLRDDAGSTSLTCTIDEAATTCSDAVNAPAIAALSFLDVFVTSAGPDADPTATASINISFCLSH